MERGQPQRLETRDMVAGGVAGIPLPAVSGIPHGQQAHQPIACDLGHDRRARDGVRAGVTVDDRGVRTDLGLEAHDLATVHEHVIVGVDTSQGAPHGQVGRVVDVEPLDLRDRRGADPPRQAASLDLRDERFALPKGQRLGVPHPGDLARVRADQHRGRHDRGAQGAHAHLVHADHQPAAGLPQSPFDAQIGVPYWHPCMLADRDPV